MKKYFESIRCENFKIYNIKYHNKRVFNTINKYINLEDYISIPNDKLLKCKIIYNKDEILDISFSEYFPKNINILKLVYDDNIIYNKKELNREALNKLYLQKDIADDIIIIKNDLITDSSIYNIAVFDGILWKTPKKPLLCGTSRHRLLNEKKILVDNINIDMLYE